MKSALRKNAFSEISDTKSRFISICCIVAIGIAFFAGVKNTCPDMKRSAHAYYSKYNLAHFRLVSTLGFSESDIEALEAQNELSVYPAYFTDVLIETGGKDVTARVMSLQNYGESNPYNSLELTEGRYPQAADECIIDSNSLFAGSEVGGAITVYSGSDDDLSETLEITEYKIVGTFISPAYIDKSAKGSTTVGNGSISVIMYIPEENFKTEAYTEVYVASKTLSELEAYSDEYLEENDRVTEILEELGAKREIERYDEIVSEANEELDKAQQELDEQKEDARRELDDAKKTLDEALKELESGEKELEDARQQLDEAKQTLEDSKAQLDSGKEELENAEKELEQRISEGQAKINENKLALEQAENEYESGLEQYKSGYAEYEDGLLLYNDGKQQYEQSAQIYERAAYLYGIVSGGQDEDGAALKELTELLGSETEISADYMGEMLAAMKIRLDDSAVQLEETEKTLSDSKAQLDETKARLDSAKLQIDSGKKQLEDAQNELNAQKNAALSQIAENRAALEDAQKQYDDGLEEYRQGELDYTDSAEKLADGRKEYEDGLAEYESASTEADEKIADAEKELFDAREELEKLEKPMWYIFDRNSNPGYEEYGQNAERINNIASVFPIFFILVAALVCLNTMSRMVEEQRSQIGTLKALGYKNSQIIFKFMLYALSATILGAFIGAIAGQKLFPFVIIKAYGMIYSVSETVIPTDWLLTLACMAASVAAVALTVYFSCKAELSEQPASLMRPKSPKAGKKILLEHLPVWKYIGFNGKVTFRNLFRYKKKMLMTVLGVAGCTALTLVGFALEDAISDIVNKQFDELVSYDGILAFDAESNENGSEIEKILSEGNGNYAVYYQKSFTFKGENGRGVTAYLIVPENIDAFSDFYVFRDRKTQEIYEPERDGVLIDEKLASLIGASKGGQIELYKDDTDSVGLTVSNIIENYPNHYVYMTSEKYKELFGETPEFNMMCFSNENLVSEDDEDDLAQRLLSTDAVLTVQFKGDLVSTMSTMLQALNSVIVVLIVSAGALAFVVLYNLTNININERIREIATLKVMGFTDLEVDGYIFRENLILTLMGIAAGLFGGYFLSEFIITTAEIDLVMFGRDIKPFSYVISAVITVGFSLIVSIYMHVKLKKVDMIEALKSVE